MSTELRDPVVWDDWHPVMQSTQLTLDAAKAAQLLGAALVLWRDSAGVVHAWEDRCPHRGTKLSMGTVSSLQGKDTLTCAYHGWVFGNSGRCQHIPALPQLGGSGGGNALTQSATVFNACEAYGLVWVCLGKPKGGVPLFPEFADTTLRKVVCGPYEVGSSGPRIVENFLDMAHFAPVHPGILGDAAHAAVPDYQVEAFDQPEFGAGIWATLCRAWQPRSNSLAEGGSWVNYTYRVVRPLTAILTKEPAAQTQFQEAISLHVQPLTPSTSRAWIILAMTNFEQSDDELRAFQDRIFSQDKPILENQSPLLLPLAHGLENSVACDRLSLAYRAYLSALGLRFGVIAQ